MVNYALVLFIARALGIRAINATMHSWPYNNYYLCSCLEEEYSRLAGEDLYSEECWYFKGECLHLQKECASFWAGCMWFAFLLPSNRYCYYTMQCCTVLKQRWVECPLKASQAYNGQSTARSTITSKSFGHHFLRINFWYSVHILTSTTTNGIRSILLHCQTNQRIDSLIINKRHGIFTRWILPHQSHTHHWGGRHGSGDILIISNYTQDITMKITSGVNYWPLHTNTKANTPTLVRGAATYNHHALLAPIWKHTHPHNTPTPTHPHTIHSEDYHMR